MKLTTSFSALPRSVLTPPPLVSHMAQDSWTRFIIAANINQQLCPALNTFCYVKKGSGVNTLNSVLHPCMYNVCNVTIHFWRKERDFVYASAFLLFPFVSWKDVFNLVHFLWWWEDGERNWSTWGGFGNWWLWVCLKVILWKNWPISESISQQILTNFNHKYS